MPRRRGHNDKTYITISNDVIVPDVYPFGLNLGYHNRFGASQILKNLIINPGFEAGEFATVLIVGKNGSPQRFISDNWKTQWNQDWLGIGQPIGFWEGAEYEVVYGQARGRRGRIVRFRHEGNRYAFYTSDQGVTFAQGDIIFLRHRVQASAAGMQAAQFDAAESRPNSFGKQSLRLEKPSNSWQWSFTYSLDSLWRDLDPHAGKLLIVDGEWELSFWLRGKDKQTAIEVEFSREGERTFFRETIEAKSFWKRVTRRISIPEGDDAYLDPANSAEARVLSLKFRVIEGNNAWLDDLSLQRADQRNPTVFSDKFVNKIKALRPGILRNWGWQLGSSLQNQLAEPTGRMMTGYSPKQRVATQYHFSLHEFLELAQEVNAQPWYVIPPTFTHLEMQNLVAYLAAPADKHRYGDLRADLGQVQPWTSVFKTIHLEYGNEMWGANQGGDPFLGATVRGGKPLGTIAGQRFSSLKKSAFYLDSAEKFNLIIGGQTNAFERQSELAQYSRHHDTIALSPYFGDLTNQDPTKQILSLYARAFQDTQNESDGLLRANISAQGDSKTAIYEINFHTTTNPNIPNKIRNRFVTGLAGGIALPLYMLRYLSDAGVRDQCAFTTLQFAFAMNGLGLDGQTVHLWGLLRDLEATGRARPTWLALQLVNRAMQGDLVQTTLRGKNPTWQQTAINKIVAPLKINYVQSFVFNQSGSYRVLLFNLHQSDAQHVEIEFPNMPLTHGWLHQLSAESPFANNESAEDVTITSHQVSNLTPQYPLTLPPHSITLLETQGFSIFLPIITQS